MATITLTLSKAEITEALRDYVENKGFLTTDRFSARVTTTPGDLPYDEPYTEAVVSGVVTKDTN